MKIDVAGRVRNVVLPKTKPLLPLYEAVINSIQAIEDANGQAGSITIKLTRDTSARMFQTDKAVRDISNFEIIDNGIGFTDENFDAFQTSDTTYKAERGGKGIGRFMWLVAFEMVVISSTYRVDKAWKTRSFTFKPKGTGVSGENVETAKEAKRLTSVSLIGFKEKYRVVGPKRLETIAAHIVEHCLEYLIRPNPPRLELIDETNVQRLDLNDIFEKEMRANAKPDKFDVEGVKFEALHVRLYSTHIEDHCVHYCANHRVVKTEKLLGRVPDLTKRLVDDEGREFVYAAYLDSKLLDETVNEERTDFSFSTDDGGMFPEDLTWLKIRDAVIEKAKAYLSPYTRPVREAKDRRIERFVETEAPMYRPILKYVSDAVGMIDPDIDDDKLDLELYRAFHDLQVGLKVEGQALLKAQDVGDSEFADYAMQFEDFLTKVSDANKADLARYVFHRRLVLDFLHKLLGLQLDGSYALEDRVHQLIFPMGESSENVLPDQHNLWLVDERLAYHKFLASDKQLRSLAPLVNKSAKEPDIIVFDKACAFVTELDGPFQAVTIIEFKRPKRTAYSDSENPIKQIREYIKKIRGGKAVTPTGHEVPVASGVHFYCYVVADKADQLDDVALAAQLDPTPDGQGYFGYLKHENAYIEIMTYRQMLTSAKQRNAVFFDKLGLPCVISDSADASSARTT
jgi:hypothetical protein